MNTKMTVFACAVLATAVTVWGEESEQPASADAAVQAKKAPVRNVFTTLPLCRLVEGAVEVRRPGEEWSAAEEGRFYPLGTSYRTGKDGRLDVAFGTESIVSLPPDSEFGTRQQSVGGVSRTVVLVRGTLQLKLADNLPEGAFFVTAPGFVVKNPAGESKYAYEDKGDGDRVTVRCVTGSLGVEGRHFEIPVMHPADEVVVRTSRDQLVTFLYGTSGDYVVRLDQGVRMKDEIGDDGQVKKVAEKATSEFRLSPKTKIVISRMVPSIGSRMSVHTMAFDAAGERKSECCFCEGRAEINSGELVAKERADSEELAKKAAEAAETTETAAATEESSAEENKSEESSTDGNEE